ncbi:MAG TPA: hypothetical protein VK966_00405, partial [Longimicrobiales bacterium]|nr:hypothetical protein [Longimicrobiales bacterium]
MRFSVLLPALLVLAGCATTGEAPAAPGEAGTPGTEAPGPREPDPRLPPIPAVDSALDLRVSYPRDSAFVATRGENFIFGSAGSGRARVWIDGQEVDVRPNGGFLAFLPVPPDGVYRVRAELDGATDTLRLPVQLPPADSPAVAPRIEPGSVYPTGAWIAQPGERVEVGFRGTAGGQARVILPDGQVATLVETTDGGTGATDFEVTPGEPPPADAPLSWYRGYFTAQAITAEDPDVPWPSLSPASPAESVDGAGPAVA